MSKVTQPVHGKAYKKAGALPLENPGLCLFPSFHPDRRLGQAMESLGPLVIPAAPGYL